MATKKNFTANSEYTLFLKDFIGSSGVTIRQLSELIDVSTVSIQHWFTIGDIRLSRLLSVADALGYDLEISVDKKPSLNQEEPVYYKFSDIRKMSLKNLHFLSCAFKESGITKKEAAERMGVTRDAVTYWFVRDDITIRNLCAVANALDRDVFIRFEKIITLNETPKGTVAIHSSIVKRSVNYIENPSVEKTAE